MGIPALETLILLVAQRGDGREHPSHRSRFSAKIIIGNTTSLQHLRLPSPATPAPLPAWTTVHQAPRAWGLSGGASGSGPPAPLTIRSWKLSLFFLISQRMLLFLLLDFFLSFFFFMGITLRAEILLFCSSRLGARPALCLRVLSGRFMRL